MAEDMTAMTAEAKEESEGGRKRKIEEDENNGVVAAAVAGDIQKEEEGEDEDVVSKENKKNHLLESAIPWRPTGSNATSGGGLVREGDLVVVYERSDRMKAVRVKKGGVLQNRFGVFEHDSWIGALPFGSIAYAKQFSKDKTVEEKPAAETKVEEMEIEVEEATKDEVEDGKAPAAAPVPVASTEVAEKLQLQQQEKKEEKKDLKQKKKKNRNARGVSTRRGFVYVLKPTCELWTLVLPHRTQILYVADIATVVMNLRLKPGCTVMESGTGSGSLTHSLYRAVAPTGKVYTFEYHEVRAEKAKEEFLEHGIALKETEAEAEAEAEAENVGGIQVEQRDIEQLGFPSDRLGGCADAVFLDLPKPWKAIPSASKCLKVGGMLCSFSPCIEQVQKTVEAMYDESCFYRMRTMEILLRPYDVKQENFAPLPDFTQQKEGEEAAAASEQVPQQQFRSYAIPSKEMRGHTGYLTFAQKVQYAEQ